MSSSDIKNGVNTWSVIPPITVICTLFINWVTPKTLLGIEDTGSKLTGLGVLGFFPLLWLTIFAIAVHLVIWVYAKSNPPINVGRQRQLAIIRGITAIAGLIPIILLASAGPNVMVLLDHKTGIAGALGGYSLANLDQIAILVNVVAFIFMLLFAFIDFTKRSDSAVTADIN